MEGPVKRIDAIHTFANILLATTVSAVATCAVLRAAYLASPLVHDETIATADAPGGGHSAALLYRDNWLGGSERVVVSSANHISETVAHVPHEGIMGVRWHSANILEVLYDVPASGFDPTAGFDEKATLCQGVQVRYAPYNSPDSP
jgi:hypothetical protein